MYLIKFRFTYINYFIENVFISLQKLTESNDGELVS